MAVKIRVQKKEEPKKEDPKPQKKVILKVKKEDPTPIEKDPSIKGPIGFLNSYYDSPMFNQRYQNRNLQPFNRSGMNLGREYYKVGEVDAPVGSFAIGAKQLMKFKNLGILAGQPYTIMLDKDQAKKYGMSLENSVLPHEYTHTTRGLNIVEENDFAQKNKFKTYLNKYPYQSFIKNDYAKSLAEGGYLNNYSDFLSNKNIESHDEQPSENYADLNSLRYMMYKQGIYDTRKGQMTMEHLKRAMNDPWLKEQYIFKRLLKHFKPEDIIQLNNTIAMNKGNDGSETVG